MQCREKRREAFVRSTQSLQQVISVVEERNDKLKCVLRSRSKRDITRPVNSHDSEETKAKIASPALDEIGDEEENQVRLQLACTYCRGNSFCPLGCPPLSKTQSQQLPETFEQQNDRLLAWKSSELEFQKRKSTEREEFFMSFEEFQATASRE